MTFRHISELAGDVMRRVEIEAARNRGSDMRAPARPAVGGVGDGSLEGGEAPVAFARRGEEESRAQTGMKGGGANPPSLLPLWTVLTRDHSRVTMHGRAVTAATGSPIPAARPYLVTLNGVRVHSDHSRRVKQIEHAKEQRHSQ